LVGGGGAGNIGGRDGGFAQTVGHCRLEVCEEGADGGNVVSRRRVAVENIAEREAGVAVCVAS